MRHEMIWVIDLVLVGGLLMGMLGAVGYVQPLVIGPLDGAVLDGDEVVFSFERAERILIDDNFQFSSPDVFLAGDVVSLEAGTWYWKAEGALGFEGEVRSVTILELVALEMRTSGGGYDVVNVGNTKLRVDVYQDGEVLEQRTVERGEEQGVGSKVTKVLGGKEDA